ncbi:PREDICTED: DNA ligase 4 [Papilio polytes]|uniref:DNA ligase 4 n=1 Tax=Papilio polytes TaxID=76194 RepID=UPI000675C1E6|nr:PREDICTED: DNA ligase 4 [Papilio polytes]XP_013133251.1 PREDICTED: DNA ligase 4 [Papilio polytes]
MSSNVMKVPAEEVLFEDVCTMLDSIAKAKKKYEKITILTNYVDDFRLKVAQITEPKDPSFYPILRLLLPGLEKERSYNLREKRLGSKLVQALAWDEKSSGSQKLLNYRANNRNQKDFATVVCEELRYTVSEKSILTVGNINEILHKIANVENGKPPTLEHVLTSVLKRINVKQLKWFLRIILKEMKLNMGHSRIFEAYDSEAEYIYDNCNDLKKVCESIEKGNTRPSQMGVEIFHSISPMLLSPLPITKLHALSFTDTYITEEKYDGERFQIHMENHIYKYFTRRGYERHNFGKTYDSGMLTPLLKNCFAPNVKSFVLDGEMMGWNEEDEEFGSKGMNFDVKALKDHSEFKPSFCAFDILYYNGVSLVGPAEKGGLPLIKRLEILDELFTDIPQVLFHSKRETVQDNSDIVAAFNKSVAEEKEGITIKNTQSYYLANRRNGGWYKTKGEYNKSTIQDLDLVIIGKRAGRYYVACVDNSGDSAQWLCMCGVGNLGAAVRGALNARLQPHWRRRADHPAPPHLHFNKQYIDHWIPPEKSVVLQVRASELVKCENYGTPYTLRFQRVVKVRYDKPVHDILTLREFEEIVSSDSKVVKLSKTISEDSIDSLANIPHKRRVKKPLQVAEQFRQQRAADLLVKSKALLGRKVCILSDDYDCSKSELIKILEAHGGVHTEHYGAETWCCVAGTLTYYVKNLIELKSKDESALDIVSSAWLRNLPDSDELCSLSPLEFLSIKKETRLKMGVYFDRFGDSYTELLNVETLRKCFEKMDSDKPPIYLTTQEKINVDKVLFDNNNPYSYLRCCFLAIPNSDSLYTIRAKMYGANLCDMDCVNVTHVVLPKMASNEDKMAAKTSEAFVVSEEWLDTCFNEGRHVQEKSFLFFY